MKTCFVMQPIKMPFDKRYEDVVVPAVEGKGLKAYRADRDPSVSVPIEAIEEGIRQARICVADISDDNFNVAFELGFAMACGKPIILLCNATRTTPFPFDVRHRMIIRYSTDADRDFSKLRQDLGDCIGALLKKFSRDLPPSSVASFPDSHETLARDYQVLLLVAETVADPMDAVSANLIHEAGKTAGLSRSQITIGLARLSDRGLLEATGQTWEGQRYVNYQLSATGIAWLDANTR